MPKLVTAIAFNIPIVAYSWVLSQSKSKLKQAAASEIESVHLMEYRACDNLFNSYSFILPTSRAIAVKGTASTVQTSFLRSLLMRTGGQIRNAALTVATKQLPQGSASAKQLIRIAPKSELSRATIDCRLTQFSSKSKNYGNQKTKEMPEAHGEELSLDFHWIIDSIYSQTIRPLEVYKIE